MPDQSAMRVPRESCTEMVEAAGQAGVGVRSSSFPLMEIRLRNGILRVEDGGKSKNAIGDSGLLNVSCHGASIATPAASLAGVEETNCSDEKSDDAAVVKVELVGAASLP